MVQLYVSAPINANLPKPEKELKAFAKTKELQAGEDETITMTIAAADLASFDESESAWVTDKGDYKFLVASSSKNIKASLNVTIAQPSKIKVNDVLKMKDSLNLLKK